MTEGRHGDGLLLLLRGLSTSDCTPHDVLELMNEAPDLSQAHSTTRSRKGRCSWPNVPAPWGARCEPVSGAEHQTFQNPEPAAHNKRTSTVATPIQNKAAASNSYRQALRKSASICTQVLH